MDGIWINSSLRLENDVLAFLPEGGADLRTDDVTLVTSPDSEQIEQARVNDSIAKLCERGANPRQGRWGTN